MIIIGKKEKKKKMMMRGTNPLHCCFFNDKHRYLKWKALQEKDRKEIWALGSSRVLQLRKQMFTTTFYNAGFTVIRIKDFMLFMKSIPKNKYP